MSERHWPHPALATTALATTALALLGATAVAGCGGGSASSTKASATETAGVAATTGQTSKQTMHGVKVRPAKCADAAVTGFNSAAFAHAPASMVTFRVGRDGVSEVLVSATPQMASTALANRRPADCQHYTATVAGKTFHYSVQEEPMTGLASQARALNVKAAGYAEVDVWSVVYRADGFVGAVTIVGPDATEASAKKLATQAYQYAAQTLT